LTSGLFAVSAGFESEGPRQKKIMQQQFSFLANLSSTVDGSPTIEEAAALYLDPRHRFLSIGADALNETEAISLVLGEHDYHLATRLLVSFGSLTALSRASLAQLSPLLGKARAMRLMAAFRLGPLSSLGQSKEAIDRPELVYNLFAQELRLADREILAVALLDTRFRLIKKEQISVGILNEALAHPREILKPAIIHSAYAFALVHNHPSGDPNPSDADFRLTRQINEAARILHISFLDHVIVGQPAPGQTGYFSFKEAGII
jgi:DNA repair protein RadC